MGLCELVPLLTIFIYFHSSSSKKVGNIWYLYLINNNVVVNMRKESINIFNTNTLQLRKALKSGGGKTLKTDLAGFLTFAQDTL